MLEELCKRIQHCCATHRRSRNKRNVGSCWLESLTGFKLWGTTRNNIQQHATGECKRTQHVISNNVAFVCTGLQAILWVFLFVSVFKKQNILFPRSFSLPHDGDNNPCTRSRGDQRLMAPSLSFDTKPWSWSNCSRDNITQFLE